MANITELTQWDANVYQIDTTDLVLGGDPTTTGILNKGVYNLANRTAYIKDLLATNEIYVTPGDFRYFSQPLIFSAAFSDDGSGVPTNFDVVYHNGIDFSKAIADASDADKAVGIADITNTKVVVAGLVQTSYLSFASGATIYLSPDTAGEIVDVETDVVLGRHLYDGLILLGTAGGGTGSGGFANEDLFYHTMLSHSGYGRVVYDKLTDADTIHTSGVLSYGSLTLSFTNGEQVTGGTSGARATIVTDVGTSMVIKPNKGSFVDNEVITGVDSGATATTSASDAFVSDLTYNSTLSGYLGNDTDSFITDEVVPNDLVATMRRLYSYVHTDDTLLTMEASYDSGLTFSSISHNYDDDQFVSAGFTSLILRGTYGANSKYVYSWGTLLEVAPTLFGDQIWLHEQWAADQGYASGSTIVVPNGGYFTPDGKSLEVYYDTTRLFEGNQYTENVNAEGYGISITTDFDVESGHTLTFRELYAVVDISDDNRARLDLEHDVSGAHTLATETTDGTVELATDPEAINNSIDDKALVPSNVNPILEDRFNYSGTAPLYGVRAWAHIDGNDGSTVGSGNLSCVRTDEGRYTFTFATAMPHANYAVTACGGDNTTSSAYNNVRLTGTNTTAGFKLSTHHQSSGSPQYTDLTILCVTVVC